MGKLTVQQKQEILQQNSIDPTKYWIDDDDNVVPLPEEGTAATALKTTLYNAPRTVLGFTGSALGGTAAGALATPETFGLGTIPAAIAGAGVGGALGGGAGEAIQNAIYPEAWKLGEEARQARAPITTKVADIGASLAFMRPSATVLKAASRAPRELASTFGRMQPQTLDALANVGIGAGSGLGMSLVQGASPGEVALETALGALQHQPTALGHLASFRQFKPFTDAGAIVPGGLPVAEGQQMYQAALANVADLAQKRAAEQRAAAEKMQAEFVKQQKAEAKRATSAARVEADLAAERETMLAQQAADEKAAAMRAATQFQQQPLRDVLGVETTPAAMPAEQRIARDLRTPDERLAEASAVVPDTQVQGEPIKPTVVDEKQLSFASPLERELSMLLSPEQHEYFQTLAKQFDTEVQPNVELGDKSGEFTPRKGAGEQSSLRVGTKAYVDVYPHELAHALIDDTLNYGSPRESALMERMLGALGMKVEVDANGRRSVKAELEEVPVREAGESAMRVLAGREKPQSTMQGFSEFMDYLLHDKMTPDTARRLLRDRMLFGGGTAGMVAKAARRGATQVQPPVEPEQAAPEPARAAAVEKPFEPVELPERLAPTRDMTPEQIAAYNRSRPSAAELAADAERVRAAQAESVAEYNRPSRAVGEAMDAQARQRRMEARIANIERLLNERDQARIAERIRAGEGPGTEVTRPETIDYTGESIPANVRRGQKMMASARETPADLEMRRIEDKLSGRDRSRYQLLDPERIFATEFEKELAGPRPFKIQVAKDGRISGNDVRAAVAKLNATERELLQSAGLNDYLSRVARPTPDELARWADANLPKVEVKQLDAVLDSSDSPEQLELQRLEQKAADLKHKLDTKGFSVVVDYDELSIYRPPDLRELAISELEPDVQDLVIQYRDAVKEFQRAESRFDTSSEGQEGNDSATRRFTQVNPRKLNDMPGAVDLLVRIPLKYGKKALSYYERSSVTGELFIDSEPTGYKLSLDEYRELVKDISRNKTRYSSHHYPESGDNLLTHVRAYEHTLPNGEKALRIFELQSDWAQARRKLESYWPEARSLEELPEWWLKGRKNPSLDTYAKDRSQVLSTGWPDLTPDHPLLAQTQRLGLKAAIEHARRRGIDKVIIDDADTAMLTEGHDQAGGRVTRFADADEVLDHSGWTDRQSMDRHFGNDWMDRRFGNDWRQGSYIGFADNIYRVDKPELQSGSDRDRKIARALKPILTNNQDYFISQEGGMRLAYDNVLPQMMRDMVGPGVKVELGAHKNALHDNKPREDLLIKNPDGTPKTQSTGVMYDVSGVQARRQAGEPFTVAGKRYQPLEEDRSKIDSLPYGYWMDRSGNLTPVRTHEHEVAASKILKELRVTRNEAVSAQQQLFDLGYLRGVQTSHGVRSSHYNDEVTFNGQSTLSEPQKKSLRNLGKDYGVLTSHQVSYNRPAVPIYDPQAHRYQPLGPERGEYKGVKLPPRNAPSRGIFAGNVEALRRTGDPDKIKFAESAQELYARIRNYTGKYEDAIVRPLVDLKSAERDRVVEALYEESDKRQPTTMALNPAERAAFGEIRAGLKLMRNDQIAANQLIDGKPAGVDPFYFPHVVDTSITHDLANNPESARAKEAERQFIDYNADKFVGKGMARAEAVKRATDAFGKFVGSLKPMSIDSGFDYGAVSMPAGTQLPPTWIAADPIDGFRSYIKRFSRARGFYDVMGRDEDAMRAIGRKTYFDAAGKQVDIANPGSRLQRDPNVRALLENALGVTHESQEGLTPAVGRLANALLLGNVATRITDAATTPFKALTYLPPQHIPGLLLNMRNIKQSMANAYKTGGVRHGDMMVVREVLGAGDRYSNALDKVTELVTRATGSEALERGARILAQNVGEYVYDVNKTLANRGDKRALDFFNRVTPKWQTLARDEMSQRIARLFQGNYDATNLPIWITNSPAAPFFSMMKWNIEQWNNFKRFAWEPARQGNLYPLMGTVIGGLLGGVAVGELREKITGKKQRVATLGELNFGFREGDTSRSAMEAMRKAAFLSQVTGTLGIVGELGLQAIDIAAKDKPQGFSWPAAELAANVVGKIANAVPAAIEKPGDAGLIALTAANDLTKEVWAQYRIASNAADRLMGGGEVAESNRRRDLRMSEKLRGEKTRMSPLVERDYRNERERQFDKTRDMAEARRIGRRMMSAVRAEAKTTKDVEDARRKFRASRIAGIPSRENDPQQFRAHINYVRQTQGEQAAQDLTREYQKLRSEQRIKAAMFR